METVVKRVDKPFDSRPSDADRLTAIATEPAAGAVTSDLPAWHLFANYDKLAGEITWEYYSAAFGKQLVHAALQASRAAGVGQVRDAAAAGPPSYHV